MLEVMHVMQLIGGVAETDYHAGRGGDVFAPVAKERQRRAMSFLMNQGLAIPQALYDPKIINRISPNGQVSEMTSMPKLILSSLLSESRIQRMVDNEVANGANAYTVAELVRDLNRSVFHEVYSPTPMISLQRRAIQRAYLETLDKRINGTSASKTDLKPLAKEDLRLVALRIDKALPLAKDNITRLHLRETRRDIQNILNNRYATQGGGAAFDPFSMFFLTAPNGSCWSRAFARD
jgi:hypothetical protein